MAYAFLGEGSLDYFPCQYGSSRLIFRGPKQTLGENYLAVIGGNEVYGKYVATPFPMLLQTQLAMPVANFGCLNAGVDLYLNEPEVLHLTAGAQACVVQVMGAHNMSNRYYSVHPRRNDRITSISAVLRSMYPGVDFTEFNFTRHMLLSLQAVAPDRFEVIAEELRAGWVHKMRQLLEATCCPTVLVWISETIPPEPKQRAELACNLPLVDAEMITAVRSKATRYIEVVSSPSARAQGLEGMVFAPTEVFSAETMPGPAAHAEVAQSLLPILKHLIGAR
jgi:hypothetical protein